MVAGGHLIVFVFILKQGEFSLEGANNRTILISFLLQIDDNILQMLIVQFKLNLILEINSY